VDGDREEALRRVLATVPLTTLHDIGVLDALLGLVAPAAPVLVPAQRRDESALIAEMDVDSLVARVLGAARD
jgi:hypothetical protein